MIYFQLFGIFFKIGLFSFGGGYAMISVIQREMERMGWITSGQYADIVAVSQMTPGPLATCVATYVGAKVFFEQGLIYSIIGAGVSALGVVLPSFIIVVLVAKLYEKFKTSHLVNSAMNGIRPAVIGVMGCAVASFGSLAFFNGTTFMPMSLVIMLIVLVLAMKTKIDTILLIVLSAILGIIFL